MEATFIRIYKENPEVVEELTQLLEKYKEQGYSNK